jgi:hypothetical protein
MIMPFNVEFNKIWRSWLYYLLKFNLSGKELSKVRNNASMLEGVVLALSKLKEKENEIFKAFNIKNKIN